MRLQRNDYLMYISENLSTRCLGLRVPWEAANGNKSERSITRYCKRGILVARDGPSVSRACTVLSGGKNRWNVNDNRSPNALASLARLRSLGGHSAGFSTEGLAHPYSSRSGRFCPLRPSSWRTDYSMAVLQLADIAEILIVLWGVDYFLQGVARLDSLKAFGKYVFVTVILGPLVVCLTGSQTLSGDRWISG